MSITWLRIPQRIAAVAPVGGLYPRPIHDPTNIVSYTLNRDAETRLDTFIALIGDILGHRKRRESFATYAIGLMGDGERKSIEPIAARAVGDPRRVEAERQRLMHFIADSEWSDREVRLAAVRYAIEPINRRGPIDSWIIDDTGMLKQGTHSVGVQRQYTGSAGKITNCQMAVSLTLASQHDHLPVDVELYLPRVWTDDRSRRAEAKVPKNIRFKTKIELALDMIREATAANLPRGHVLADSFYGDVAHFRAGIRKLGLHYAVAVSNNITVWPATQSGTRDGEKIAVGDLGAQLPEGSFRRITWAQGTKAALSARFAVKRVIPCRNDGTPAAQREAVWLVIEWEDSQRQPTKYYFVSLPADTTRKALVRTLKKRWRTERVYEDMKGELGFDHYEGRSFPGWHHHVSVALCCFAFVASERAIAFSPGGGAEDRHEEHYAPRAPLPRLVHYHPPRGRPDVRSGMAAKVPAVQAGQT